MALYDILLTWAGKTEWAHALAGGLSVRGAEGSFAGLTANVPEAVELINNKENKKICG